MSSQLTERPSWWDTVKEIDIEEARVLLALGQEVWYDYRRRCAFDKFPYLRRLNAVDEDMDLDTWKSNCDILVFYVRKGESVDNNEEKGL